MSTSVFERILAAHCSPVLMGHKIANLVSMEKSSLRSEILNLQAEHGKHCISDAETDTEMLLESYRTLFSPFGIEIKVLCSCKQRLQILFFHPALLEEYLKQSLAKGILVGCGYPEDGSLEEYLQILQKRFAAKDDFPHEIGLFLGYPQEDVREFIRQKGRNFKACRYWKVYSDVEEAYRLFSIYDRCRDFVLGKLDAGYSIMQIVNMRQVCVSA